MQNRYIIYELVKPDFYEFEFDETYYDEVHKPDLELKRELNNNFLLFI